MGKDSTAITEQGAITPNDTYVDSQNTTSIDVNEEAQELLKAKKAEEGIKPSSDMIFVFKIYIRF